MKFHYYDKDLHLCTADSNTPEGMAKILKDKHIQDQLNIAYYGEDEYKNIKTYQTVSSLLALYAIICSRYSAVVNMIQEDGYMGPESVYPSEVKKTLKRDWTRKVTTLEGLLPEPYAYETKEGALVYGDKAKDHYNKEYNNDLGQADGLWSLNQIMEMLNKVNGPDSKKIVVDK